MYRGNQHQRFDRFQRTPSPGFPGSSPQHHFQQPQNRFRSPPHQQGFTSPQFSPYSPTPGPSPRQYQQRSPYYSPHRYQSPHSFQGSTPRHRGGKRGGRGRFQQNWGRGNQPVSEQDIERLYYKHSMVKDPWASMKPVSVEGQR
ncbi:uncharacterized protein LOC100372817 [Saccoglossus kowalevskii]|uniref:M-phase-specific PLK1-interacting protein-like n=1 Tax=Saccoglossus kowalevskii TaxID=10224 RepID=A0ABM0GNJ3_SACKO|nr:PREDICTED: M-phase-specific PLK1-interacting protein-like [Saccoglossus kowalevskii]